MSPARRRLLLALAALVLAGAVAAVVTLVVSSGGDERVRAADRTTAGAVVLVPGYGGSTGALQTLADRLTAAGRTATVVDLPDDGTGDLAAQADVLDAAVQRALRAGAPSVDLVGYSAGGVVTRIWLADGGAADTRRVVTLGSPHHGTTLAAAGTTVGTSACPQACRQLTPGSRLLADLPETLPGPAYLSLWTTEDTTVEPPDSARLQGATNVVLQDVCPGARTSHGDLPRDPKVQAIVVAALSGPALTAPSSCS
jgi:uncharacterized alpha/beta hydrolase family protein